MGEANKQKLDRQTYLGYECGPERKIVYPMTIARC